MDILKHPDAQALLEDAQFSAAAVRSSADHLETFVARYLTRFYRDEQRQHTRTIPRGKLTGLQRKTTGKFPPRRPRPGPKPQGLGP
jgi:hypothetical protein